MAFFTYDGLANNNNINGDSWDTGREQKTVEVICL